LDLLTYIAIFATIHRKSFTATCAARLTPAGESRPAPSSLDGGFSGQGDEVTTGHLPMSFQMSSSAESTTNSKTE